MEWAKVTTGKKCSPLVFAMPRVPAEREAKPFGGKKLES